MTKDEELIEAVYVKPIRSVIALDDQFPTIDLLLDAARSSQEEKDDAEFAVASVKFSPAEVEKARSLVACCRKRQWIVDVHDGSQVLRGEAEQDVLTHLHQTDLLIVDYKLEGEMFGGDRAVKIIRRLAENEHFNIVVVYTKEEAKQAFTDIALSLLKEMTIPDERSDEVEEFWEDWVGEDAQTTTVLKNLIDVGVYLYARRRSNSPDWTALERVFPALTMLKTAVAERVRSIKDCTITHSDVAWGLLGTLQSTLHKNFYAQGAETISVTPMPTNDLNWLRTKNLFLTVVPKALEGEAIVDRLRTALVSWGPSPLRLIVGALRAELEGRAGAIEDAVLDKEQLQAGILKQLMSTDDATRVQCLESTIESHWADILQPLKNGILPTAEKIIANEAERCGRDPDIAVLRYHDWYNSEDKSQAQKVIASLNSYISTRSVQGPHLATGHIFKYDADYWICLSPLCDLVPDQGASKRWKAHLGNFMPFKAVKLLSLEETKKAVKYATSNLCLFLELDGQLKCFGFVDPSGPQGDVNPHWEQMFAAEKGTFGNPASFQLSVIRSDPAGALKLSEPEAVPVVAQLRYEYALNLLQRLGNNLCRIGLDYVGSF